MRSVHDTLEAWAAAERLTDAAATADLLTDDFVGVGPVGFQLAKSAWIDRLTDGGLRYDELSLSELRVREYPTWAHATARLDTRGTARGNPLPTTRTSFALAWTAGSWQIAAIQHSFILGAPGSPVPARQP